MAKNKEAVAGHYETQAVLEDGESIVLPIDSIPACLVVVCPPMTSATVAVAVSLTPVAEAGGEVMWCPAVGAGDNGLVQAGIGGGSAVIDIVTPVKAVRVSAIGMALVQLREKL